MISKFNKNIILITFFILMFNFIFFEFPYYLNKLPLVLVLFSFQLFFIKWTESKKYWRLLLIPLVLYLNNTYSWNSYVKISKFQLNKSCQIELTTKVGDVKRFDLDRDECYEVFDNLQDGDPDLTVIVNTGIFGFEYVKTIQVLPSNKKEFI